ncbi:hypothetical protein J4218_02245 [Candidatus Pacearchaeota archaeon]|nr:hypothetical protein [Candidatus Pacearchaeota archaeon]
MVEIIHLEGPECIGAHRADRYEDPAAHHNRHDFRHNMRFQLTANELELLSQECAVRADAVRFGTEKPLGQFWVVGSNGQLGDENLVFDGQNYLMSGRLCTELKEKGYVETTSPLGDISVLVKRN